MTPVSQALQELLTAFILFLPKIIVALVVFAASLLVAALLARAVRRSMERRGSEVQITLLITRLTRWGMIILGVVLALQQVDFDVTAFLAGLGVAGFTIGFAIQDVSKNFVAGMLLLLQQPFNIGDFIEVGDFSGTVQAIDLRATQLRTVDGKTVLIPNADVFTSAIVSYSQAAERRLDLTVSVPYESDLDQVSRTAMEAIHAVDGVLQNPAPTMGFSQFGASGINFTLYYWIDTGKTDYLTAQDAGVRAIKHALEKAGIAVAYPVQLVIARQ
ncbi:MAG: mechanosensitive ion channel family protein [Anaerolineales bacterium]|nr:mechanosensitive ion channel family protein [Anaerolineales bacterium]